MDRASLDALLDAVAAGQVTPYEAAQRLERLPFADLTYAKVDTHRQLRTGLPEVVFAPGKTHEQIRGITRALLDSQGAPLLITRAGPDIFDAVRDLAPEAAYSELGRVVVLRPEIGAPIGSVGIVTAGSSDLPVAEEAAVILEAASAKVDRIADVGVAGLHRILSVSDQIRAYDVLIVVAGMEGALPSLVGGMVACPVIAVPTSVGYGSSFGGLAALLAMLNSCAPGVAVTNIDNGFGAAALAIRMLRMGKA
ncbi:MAG TPA: nickel pincer cofactor biosynthesis protein LarB [Actinomycetota bacterium]|nr:nickel pincer cofactor biosynthesis protein LarB [Actinomycetota bacterium]